MELPNVWSALKTKLFHSEANHECKKWLWSLHCLCTTKIFADPIIILDIIKIDCMRNKHWKSFRSKQLKINDDHKEVRKIYTACAHAIALLYLHLIHINHKQMTIMFPAKWSLYNWLCLKDKQPPGTTQEGPIHYSICWKAIKC